MIEKAADFVASQKCHNFVLVVGRISFATFVLNAIWSDKEKSKKKRKKKKSA